MIDDPFTVGPRRSTGKVSLHAESIACWPARGPPDLPAGYSVTMVYDGPGYGSAILVAVLLTVAMFGLAGVSRLLASGYIGPNPMVGIRLRPLLASEDAWQRGHQAAVRPLTVAAVAGFLAMVGSVLVARHLIPYLILVGVGLVIVIVGVVVAAVRAVRAARKR